MSPLFNNFQLSQSWHRIGLSVLLSLIGILLCLQWLGINQRVNAQDQNEELEQASFLSGASYDKSMVQRGYIMNAMAVSAVPPTNNDEVGLNPLPSWLPDHNGGVSYALAWGDIDGDNDLDLVIGNQQSTENIHIYLNENGQLQTTPQTFYSRRADSISLGDYDGDGDLDLAVGGWNDRISIFENSGGNFKTSPKFQSSSTFKTANLNWADINGDGWIDLVVGTGSSPTDDSSSTKVSNFIYLNENGQISAVSIFTFPEEDANMDIKLGDIDGNGTLDIIASTGGNNQASKTTTVWRNESNKSSNGEIILSKDVILDSWGGLALGDIDNDGDLDLVSGGRVYTNTGKPSHIITNTNYYAFTSLQIRRAVLGDVDSDGDLDLATVRRGIFPSHYEPSRVFLNVGGILTETNMWESQDEDLKNDVAWGDVDGDGDLDLAVTKNRNTGFLPISIYFNEGEGGGLQTDSDNLWSPNADNDKASRDVAWGDFDNDGDLDLAVGNFQNPDTGDNGENEIYENISGL